MDLKWLQQADVLLMSVASAGRDKRARTNRSRLSARCNLLSNLLNRDARSLTMRQQLTDQTLGFPDRQLPGSEGRRHAIIHTDGPSVLIFNYPEGDHYSYPKQR